MAPKLPKQMTQHICERMQNDSSYREIKTPVIALLLAACGVAFSGCGGGGSSAPTPAPTPVAPPAGNPSIQVLPQTFSFGKVTTGNVPAPLEVTIKNVGNAALQISSITFQAPADPGFILTPSAGVTPCASVSPNIAAGDSCTLQVAFQPANTAAFSTVLQVGSNDLQRRFFHCLSRAAPSRSPPDRAGQSLDTVCPSAPPMSR